MRARVSWWQVMVLTTAAFAQRSLATELPANLPPGGPIKPVVSPAVQQHTLANGLSVWLVERPTLPKVAFLLQVRGGDSGDPASAPGLSRVMARAMLQGTATKSSRQIAEAAQGTGGSITATVNSDSVQVVLDSLTEHAADGLSLLGDLVQHATFPASEVAQVKSNMEDELRSDEGEPHFLARRAWFRVVYGDHPYSTVAASRTTLHGATSESLRELYARMMRPDQSLLVVTGKFDSSRLMKDIERAFGGWKAGTAERVTAAAPHGEVVRKIYYVERPASVQTTLMIGALGPTLKDADYPFLRLANTVYGGSYGSRLVTNIREEKGYTYTPGSRVSARRFSGDILTTEDVRNEVTGASLKETIYELDRISSGPPTSSELTQARRYLVGTTSIQLQSRMAVAALLGKYWIDGVPSDHLTGEMAAIQSASEVQVAQAAAKYLKPERMNVVAVGEKSVVLEQLKPFGLEIVAAPNQ